MTRIARPLALAALVTPAAAAAAPSVAPADTASAIHMRVSAAGETVRITASAPLVVTGNGDGIGATRCDDGLWVEEGTRVFVVDCHLAGPLGVDAGRGDDRIAVDVGAGVPAHAIEVHGRRGADRIVVDRADSGLVTVFGDADTDTYELGTGDGPLVVGVDASVRVDAATNDASTGELITAVAEVNGYLRLVGSDAADSFVLDLTVAAVDGGARVDVEGGAGDDLIDFGPTRIEHAAPHLADRAVLSVLSGGGHDTMVFTGDLIVDIASSLLVQSGGGDDTLDLAGADVHAAGLGGGAPTSQERIDSAYLSLAGNRGADTFVDAHGWITTGGATVTATSW